LKVLAGLQRSPQRNVSVRAVSDREKHTPKPSRSETAPTRAMLPNASICRSGLRPRKKRQNHRGQRPLLQKQWPMPPITSIRRSGLRPRKNIRQNHRGQRPLLQGHWPLKPKASICRSGLRPRKNIRQNHRGLKPLLRNQGAVLNGPDRTKFHRWKLPSKQWRNS